MTIGYNTILRLNRAAENAKSLGFKFGPTRVGVSDALSLYPNDEALPNYTRDAELFTGELSQVESFLTGVLWSRQYLTMLGLVSNSKIDRKEQNVRHRKLLALLNKVE